VNFVDKTIELAFLEEKWRWPQAQFIILWGKKRVGTTERIKLRETSLPYIRFLKCIAYFKKQMYQFSANFEKSTPQAAISLFYPANVYTEKRRLLDVDHLRELTCR
jgi:AAA+ ATPase superfamily predicted ATPase